MDGLHVGVRVPVAHTAYGGSDDQVGRVADDEPMRLRGGPGTGRRLGGRRNSALACGRNTSPASVRWLPLAVRSSRRTPSCCSRRRICRLRDGWAMCSSGGGAGEMPLLGHDGEVADQPQVQIDGGPSVRHASTVSTVRSPAAARSGVTSGHALSVSPDTNQALDPRRPDRSILGSIGPCIPPRRRVPPRRVHYACLCHRRDRFHRHRGRSRAARRRASGLRPGAIRDVGRGARRRRRPGAPRLAGRRAACAPAPPRPTASSTPRSSTTSPTSVPPSRPTCAPSKRWGTRSWARTGRWSSPRAPPCSLPAGSAPRTTPPVRRSPVAAPRKPPWPWPSAAYGRRCSGCRPACTASGTATASSPG